MDTIRRSPVLVLSLLVLVEACGEVVDNDGINHACTMDENGEWEALPTLDIEHVEPETCPITRQATLQTGSTLIEHTTGVPGAMEDVTIRVWDNYDTGSFSGLGLKLAEITNNFSLSGTGPGAVWRAQTAVSFAPRLNPDWMEMEIDCFDNFSCGVPKAWVELAYAGEVE